jgi:hypothetical protein
MLEVQIQVQKEYKMPGKNRGKASKKVIAGNANRRRASFGGGGKAKKKKK